MLCQASVNERSRLLKGPVPHRRVKSVLTAIGFRGKDRYFIHPETEFFVEFPTGPLTVGDERIQTVATRDAGGGRPRLLSPTDCVKDRVAAFFHWNGTISRAVPMGTALDNRTLHVLYGD